jgi:DNA repair exonuclease SbcCD ATPase subunit
MINDIIGTNFLSYQDQFHLHINQGQLNVVIGRSTSDYADSNGTGKTSLLKALLWCLYGKYPGMEDADSVVNKSAKKNTEVRVHFQKHGTEYVVQRYRKHSEHKNSLVCWEGTHQHAGDLKVVQTKIEEIVGMDYDVFLSTLVFTGEREDEFASGTDKDQKKVLNALLPLHFERSFDYAAMQFANATKAVETATTRIAVLEGQVEPNQRELETLTQQITTWDNQRAEDIKTHEHAIDAATASLETMAPHEKTFAEKEEQWQQFFQNLAQPQLQRERDDLFKEKRAVESELQAHLNALTNQSYKQQEIQAINQASATKQAQLEEQIRALTDGDNDHCPTCGQVVQNEAKQRTLKTIQDQLQLERDGCTQRVARKNQELDQLKDMILVDPEERQAALDGINSRLKEIETTLTKAEEGAAQQRANYNQHKQAYDGLRTQAEEQRRALAVAEQGLARLNEHTVNPYRDQVDRKAEAIRLAEKELEGARQSKIDAEVGMRRWSAVKTMFSGGRGGLHHFVFEQVLPEMTAMAQMFLNFFSANTLKVGFESHKKKGKKVIEGFFVKAERNDVTGFGNLSRGEQRRINVAISLTLYLMASKHVFNPGILFLDEVADSLDQTGKQSIIELLEHFCSQYDTAAVLLTNERELIAHVHSGYECVMHNDVSTLAPISES